MDFLSIVLGILFTWTLFQALLSISRGRITSSRRLPPPPGPATLPVIGNLNKLGQQPHKSLAEQAKTHGPIMALKLGQITAIVVSSPTTAGEVLQKHDLSFSNRSVPDAIRAHNHHQLAVVWLPVSTQWRNLRKIMNLHIFSAHKLDSTQLLRRQKVAELVAYVHKCAEAGVAVDIGGAAFSTTLNLLSNTIFSMELVDITADTAQEFRDTVSEIVDEAGKPNLADYFPALRKLDPQGIRRRMEILFGKLTELFEHMVDHRLESMKLDGGSRSTNDVLDILVNLSAEDDTIIDRTHVIRLMVDLFIAGNDTTSSTLEWAMAELLHNPETLDRARSELYQIIGEGKLVEESDVARLPYLQAIVKETLRLHPPAPLLIPRSVQAETELCGFAVPKGAQLLVNAWAIARDPSVWTRPDSFEPERFVGSEVDLKGRDFELVPFGGGRRICPGLPLAMRMVHLMLGSLVNSFDWKLEGEMNMEEKFGITLHKAQPLRAVPVNL